MWTSTASRKPSPTLEQRLLAGLKEDPSTGCWMWARGTGTHGRGVIRFNSDKMVTVPRAAGFVWLGVPIEGDGEVVVCHKCDQPLCGPPIQITYTWETTPGTNWMLTNEDSD